MDTTTIIQASETGNTFTQQDGALWFQILISLGTVIILFLTLRAQLKSSKAQLESNKAQLQSNQTQLKVVELEQWSKRAQYLPHVEMKLDERVPFKSDDYGGSIPTIVGKYSLDLNVFVVKNSITKLSCIATVINTTINAIPEIINDENAFYKEGSCEIYPQIIEFTIHEKNVDKLNTSHPIDIRFTIFYSDLIGNEYKQSLEYSYPSKIKTSHMVIASKHDNPFAIVENN